jgi:transcriptional regulator with PAS, ATPase and Fis domain
LCGYSKTLIEAELFGYEGGAFTGAELKGKLGKLKWLMVDCFSMK